MTKEIQPAHTCPVCAANVWGKPSTLVECVACRRVLQAAS